METLKKQTNIGGDVKEQTNIGGDVKGTANIREVVNETDKYSWRRGRKRKILGRR